MNLIFRIFFASGRYEGSFISNFDINSLVLVEINSGRGSGSFSLIAMIFWINSFL
jgi:hypothetical protein